MAPTAIAKVDGQHCVGGDCGKGQVCRDLVWQMGYCLEPRVREKALAGHTIVTGDWSGAWYRTDRLGKKKKADPLKEPAPKRVKVKVTS